MDTFLDTVEKIATYWKAYAATTPGTTDDGIADLILWVIRLIKSKTTPEEKQAVVASLNSKMQELDQTA